MRKPLDYSTAIRDSVRDSIMEKHSVIAGKRNTLEIKGLHFDPFPDPTDYARQKTIQDTMKSEGINMYADVVLKNNKTGEILDQRNKMKIGLVPTLTDRHSFLINGKEYIVHNQMRLRPAIYTKVNRIGLPQADFNLSKGSNLSIKYLPAKQQLLVKTGGTHIPLYTILKEVYKIPDQDLKKKFGSHHEQELQKFRSEKTHLPKLYETLLHKEYSNPATAALELQNYFNTTRMEPDTNIRTLGVGYDRVTKDSLLHAASEVLKIYRGVQDPTLKDNLAFKSIHSTEDFLRDRLVKPRPVAEMHMRMKSKIDRTDKIARTGVGQILGKQIQKFFTESDLVNFPLQVNPLEFLENAHKITSMGEGGVADTHSLPVETRNLHLSQQGYIDPVRTPDNIKAGVDLRMSVMAYKEGNHLKIPVKDKNNKLHIMKHTDIFDHVYTIDTEPVHKNGLVRAFFKGKMIEVPKEKVEYFIPSQGLLTVTTGSIPFTQATQGQRNAMGAKMLTQSLSLINREPPIADTTISKLISSYYIPKAPVDGVVKEIHDTHLIIKGKDGVDHKVNVAKDLALNYHSFLDVTLSVKKGDTVKAGQLLGDNNFTKGGKMALGVNANVAFIPYRGWNFEDGFVVTETGAKKFTSQHIFQEVLQIPDSSVVPGSNVFIAAFPKKFNFSQLSALDNGVVKKGQVLKNGDPLILAVKKRVQSPEIMQQGKAASRIANPFSDISIKWTKDYPGTVIDVVRSKDRIKVVVKAIAPLVEGDKIASRYGSKGIVTKIIPDKEAPRYKDGTVPDVLINPAAVPSRMNLGQIYETQIAKALATKGETIEYDNLNSRNLHEETKNLLKKYKVSDTDTLYDPISKKNVPEVFTGIQYFLKLAKQTETNYSARAGGQYDIDMRPVKGGEEGAKSIGTLDFYGLLSHNSRNFLKEASTYRSEYNPEVWSAIYQGKPLPPAKVPFTFEKTMEMLRGMGVNVQRRGDNLQALPFTDKDILALSKGEIKEPKMTTPKNDPVTGLNYRPEKGGLFDPGITGGLIGTNYAHITLATPLVNTMFEKPIRSLLDLKQTDFNSILDAKKTIDVDGEAMTGGEAIRKMLSKIDVVAEYNKVYNQLEGTKSILKRDALLKKLKYLKALKAEGYKAEDAYTIRYVPVIPPRFRPIYPKETGEIVTADANHLYKDVILANNSLNSPLVQALGKDSDEYKERVSHLNKAYKALQGLDNTAETASMFNDRKPAGFLDIIKGKHQPKYGYFQNKVMTKAQDIVARATIAPDPRLSLDQCGLPEEIAWTIYGPFVIGSLVQAGYAFPKAEEEVNNHSQLAKNALIAEMKKRPVVLNRAPTLHKFGMLAFWPQLVSGKTLYICPTVVKGFGADFDGDSLYSSVFQRFKKVYNETFLWYNVYRDNLKDPNKEVFNMPIYDKIRTQTGVTHLKDFPRLEDTKVEKGNIVEYDVPEGVEVLIATPSLTYEWAKPEKFSIHKSLSMLNVTTHTHRSVITSKDHSLRTLDENLDLVPVEPQEGLIVPARVKPVAEYSIESIGLNLEDIEARKHTFKKNMSLSYEVGHLLGSIVGDGWVSKQSSGALHLCFASITPELDKQWKTTIEQYITNEPVHFSDVDNAHTFEGHACESRKITWQSAGDFATLVKEWVGHKAQNKHLPPFSFESPLPFRKGLLAGLIDTDGTVTNNASGKRVDKPQPNINITTTSSTLAFELQALAQSLGLVAGVTPSKTPKGEDCYVVFFNSESCIKLKSMLILYHPAKAKNLKEIREDIDITRPKYSPPLSEDRLKELGKMIGAPRLYKKGTKDLITNDPVKLENIQKRRRAYTNIYDTLKMRDGRKGFLTLGNCLDVIHLIEKELLAIPFWSKWVDLIKNTDTEWELITKIEPVPNLTEAYDLTIPPHYTMVSASGIVVHDTMTIHMPVSVGGIEDAIKMLPSKNLTNIRDNSLMHVPDIEPIMGLHLITKPKSDKVVKTFRTAKEAKLAFEKGEIDVNDLIEVGTV